MLPVQEGLAMANNVDFWRVCKDRDEWRERAEELMDTVGMPYPLDADDEPIRIGDVLDGDYSFLPAKVVGYHECCGDVLPIVENDGEFQVSPERVTHYVEPDVEDVLREMLDEHRRWFDGEGERTIGEMVADYAGRLQLKED